MTQADFIDVEQQLNLRLPKHFKKAHTEFDLILSRFALDEQQLQEIATYEFIRSIEELIKVNQNVRNKPAWWSKEHKTWPEDLLVIGEDNCGGFWYINVSDEAGPVGYYEHETGQFEWQYSNLLDFLQHIAEDYKANGESA